MTERVWTTFKDDLPPAATDIYVTDHTQVWVVRSGPLCAWDNVPQDHPEYAWSPIELPEAPKKKRELHRCRGHGGSYCVGAGDERLTLSIATGPCSFQMLSVQVCPFCGYEGQK